MADLLRLMSITAQLHAAAREPHLWPEAWQALTDWLCCPEVFGSNSPGSDPPEITTQELLIRQAAAQHCAKSGTGRCGLGPEANESKRHACEQATLHLGVALSNHQHLSCSTNILDTLPMPMGVCSTIGKLVLANRELKNAIEGGRWLALRDGTLRPTDSIHAKRFSQALTRFTSEPTVIDAWLPGPPASEEVADIACRKIAEDKDGPLILVTLIVHRQETDQAALERITQRYSLTPRQADLAGHLLAGRTLNDAASLMGISRRTAKDHLARLFEVTSTARQTDLVAKLAR